MNEPIYESLPRGRHHLTREQVVASQRSRMLVAMSEAVAEKGYVHTTVADVLKRARVSRETFYQHFNDREACFLASLEHSATVLVSVMGSTFVDNPAPPRERFERAIEAYLATLVAEPAVAHAFLVDSFAAGHAAVRRRFAVQDQFADAVAANFSTDPAWQALPDPAFTARLLVGGISSLVANLVAAGRHKELPTLKAPTMALLDHLLA